jgi:hypothetical protein
MLVRQRQASQLALWLEQCLSSGIPDLQTFAEGLRRKYAVMEAALMFSVSSQ